MSADTTDHCLVSIRVCDVGQSDVVFCVRPCDVGQSDVAFCVRPCDVGQCDVVTLCVYVSVLTADVDDSEVGVVGGSELRPARGKRPIFDCYWNGRLIPYSTIDEYVALLHLTAFP